MIVNANTGQGLSSELEHMKQQTTLLHPEMHSLQKKL
jgi:hypothetical protein